MKYLVIFFTASYLMGGANAQTAYNVVTFSVPGSTYTTVVAINNSGEAVGFYGTTDPNHPVLGFDRSPSGAITTVIPPGTTGTVFVDDVTDSEEIAGTYSTTVNNANLISGFIGYSGKFRTVDVRGASTQLFGLNNQGAYVGIYRGSNYYPGFWFSRSTGFSIIYYPGSDSTSPSGINSTNEIVGVYGDINGFHGFLLNAAGEYSSIDHPGAVSTNASKINNAGIVAGTWTLASSSTGFLYNNGQFQDFKVPGAVNTYLNGINDSGTLCGDYSGMDGVQLGFIATPVQ